MPPRKQAKKKKEKESTEEMRKRFGNWVSEIFRAGPAFTMETLERYEEEAVKARQQRQAIREVTPRPAEEKDILGELVFKKVPKQKQGQEPIRPPMTRKALDDALTLVQIIEDAKSPRDLNRIKKWMEGG